MIRQSTPNEEADPQDDREEYLEGLEEDAERRANKRGRKPKMVVDGASARVLNRLIDRRNRGESDDKS